MSGNKTKPRRSSLATNSTPEARGTTQTVVRTQISETHGPLPHPAILAQYDQVHPGLAERIVRLAEGEAEHRRAQQSAIVTHNVTYEKRGQTFAMAAVISIVALAALMTALGQAPAGAWVAGTIVVGVVGAFIGNRVARAQAPKER